METIRLKLNFIPFFMFHNSSDILNTHIIFDWTKMSEVKYEPVTKLFFITKSDYQRMQPTTTSALFILWDVTMERHANSDVRLT